MVRDMGRAVWFITIAYAALVGWRSIVVFHRENTRSPVHITSGVLSADEAVRMREAKRGAIEAFVIALPWALVLPPVLPPGSVAVEVLVFLLNVATVFAISTWLCGPRQRTPK
jgi:hypothetical protein